MAMTTLNAMILMTIMTLFLQIEAREIKQVVSLGGQSVLFECDLPKSKPPQIKWFNNVLQSKGPSDLVYDSTVDEANILSTAAVGKLFSISPKDHSLTLSASVDDLKEGSFWCESKVDEDVEKQEYYLTLIKEKPKCSESLTYKEGEEILATCQIDLPVELSMYPHMGVQPVQIGDDFEETILEYTMKATPELDGKVFECRVKNDTKFSCSIKFTVKYAVTALSGPDKGAYIVGEEIHCGAIGNPLPHLTMLMDGEEIKSEETNKLTYTLGEDLVTESDVAVKCIARNQMDDKLKTIDETYNITVGVKPEVPAEGQSLLGDTNNMILIIILVIVAILIILIIIAFVLYKKKKNSQLHKTKQATLLKSDHRKDYGNDSIGA